jgi:hypothetical protein
MMAIPIEILEASPVCPIFTPTHGPVVSGYGSIAHMDPLVLMVKDKNQEVSPCLSSTSKLS